MRLRDNYSGKVVPEARNLNNPAQAERNGAQCGVKRLPNLVRACRRYATILLLMLLMVAGGNNAVAQDTVYHPFADHSVWSVNNIKYGTWGDTVICGKNYLKVYKQEEDHPFVFNVEQAEYFCAIRNDTAAQRVYGVYKEATTVYLYNQNTHGFQSYYSTDTTEFLLYDFSITEGDTVTIASFDDIYNTYYQNGIYLYTITPFQSQYDYDILLNDSTTRKVRYMDLLYVDFGEQFIREIEGIGNIHSPFTIGTDGFMYPWEGSILELICYEQDNNLLLHRLSADYEGDDDCFSFGNVSVTEIKEQQWKVYPNPANGFVHIELLEQKGNTNKQLSVYAITGQIIDSYIFNSHNFEINLQNYPSGIYIIKVTDETGIVLQEKIIKQ